MIDKDDYILVKRKDAAKFLKDFCCANYAMQLFTHLAEIRKLEIHMDTDECCKLLGITRLELERYRNKHKVKTFLIGGYRVYSAYDIVILAERIHRNDRFRNLLNLPGYLVEELELQ